MCNYEIPNVYQVGIKPAIHIWSEKIKASLKRKLFSLSF